MNSEIGRRCTSGCTTWPDDPRFSICTVCEKPTKRYRGVKSIKNNEAESLCKHAEFERYYATIEHDEAPLDPEVWNTILAKVEAKKAVVVEPKPKFGHSPIIPLRLTASSGTAPSHMPVI